ncbi:MAG: RraA family protein [Bryobacteraceae bacterium]
MSLTNLLHQLMEYDSALLANTIGYIDPTPAHEIYMGGSIECQTPAISPLVGIAVTCEMDSSSPGGEWQMEPFYEQVEQMREMKEPVVWVVKAVGSRPDHECILGDGMAKSLYSVGCAGVVTDGGLRDVAGFMTIPFHAFAKGRVIHHCALRIRSINQPVEVGGVVIRPGDVIHGSQEGVIRIPPACLERLPERAAKMRAFEHEAHAILRQPEIAPRDKKQRVGELLLTYGFAK